MKPSEWRFRGRLALALGLVSMLLTSASVPAWAQTNTVNAISAATCITPQHACSIVPIGIARTDATPMLAFSVTFSLSSELALCGTPVASITEGDYLTGPSGTTFQVRDRGNGTYTADGVILGQENCGVTGPSGTLFDVHVTNSGGSGTGTVTVNSVTLRDCSNATLGSSLGTVGSVTIDLAPVTVDPVTSPQTVAEQAALTVTPHAVVSACATGPLNWSVSPALPSGANLDAATGVVTWTPDCAAAEGGAGGTYGPFTLTATAASGEFGTAAFSIQVDDTPGTVAVAVTPHPQTVEEQSTLTVTPALTLGGCATGHAAAWSVSPGLPSGALLDPGTGVITWTPACGTAASYGPFTLTATVVDGSETYLGSDTFGITVSHKAGTVTVSALVSPQTGAEGALLTVAPDASVTPCAGTLTWSVSPALPGGASLNSSTGVITWTPDCAAAEGGSGGDYGPFTLTALASTGESGSSNAFVLHVTDTPQPVDAVDALGAEPEAVTGAGDGRVGLTVTFSAPVGATSVEVYRAPFGNYPEYDDAPNAGAAPVAPGYPPAGPWTLTAVTASGQVDDPPTRDVWYYVAFARNACGDVSPVSAMTGGTLNYRLGDVTNGVAVGSGDNVVSTADISVLGSHYGLTDAAVGPYGFLDVGPTTTSWVDGRPLTDDHLDFEDLVIFAINYHPLTALKLVRGQTAAEAPVELTVDAPGRVSAGDGFAADLALGSAPASLVALSAKLSWNASVVEPVGYAAGDALTAAGGVALSASPGSVDAALLGGGLPAGGALARVTFRAIAGGEPGIGLAATDARDLANHPVAVNATVQTTQPRTPAVTQLAPPTPNPARGTSTLAFSLARRGTVDLAIYAVNGRRAATLAHGVLEPGEYSRTWDGHDRAGLSAGAGVYYVRLVVDGRRYTRALTYLR